MLFVTFCSLFILVYLLSFFPNISLLLNTTSTEAILRTTEIYPERRKWYSLASIFFCCLLFPFAYKSLWNSITGDKNKK